MTESPHMKKLSYSNCFQRLGWMDGVKVALRQQRNDGGGWATMRERPEGVESPGTYVTEWVSRKSAQLLKIKVQVSSICAKGCILMIVFVLSDLTWLPLLGVGRKSWYIINFFSHRLLSLINCTYALRT